MTLAVVSQRQPTVAVSQGLQSARQITRSYVGPFMGMHIVVCASWIGTRSIAQGVASRILKAVNVLSMNQMHWQEKLDMVVSFTITRLLSNIFNGGIQISMRTSVCDAFLVCHLSC